MPKCISWEKEYYSEVSNTRGVLIKHGDGKILKSSRPQPTAPNEDEIQQNNTAESSEAAADPRGPEPAENPTTQGTDVGRENQQSASEGAPGPENITQEHPNSLSEDQNDTASSQDRPVEVEGTASH